MRRNVSPGLRILAVVATAAIVLPSLACVGIPAQIFYMIKGEKVDAEYDALEGKRVAVICVSNTSAFGPDSETSILSRSISRLLLQNVDDIEVVGHDEIADWIDTHDWDRIDYRQIGRGVKADMVVAVNMRNFRYHEGTTLFQGRADLEVSVYDMSRGGVETWNKSLPEQLFPANSASYPSSNMSDAKFRNTFLNILAQNVAKHFYDYDLQEDFGQSTVLMH